MPNIFRNFVIVTGHFSLLSGRSGRSEARPPPQGTCETSARACLERHCLCKLHRCLFSLIRNRILIQLIVITILVS